MSQVTINGNGVPSQLMQLLISKDNIEPGTPAGYEMCKQLFIYHPLGGKIVEKPIQLALSKERQITIDAQPKEMLIEAFQNEWESLQATDHIRDVMYITRTYGAGGIVYGGKLNGKDLPTNEPIDPWDLQHLEIYFNKLDPLNMAGSIVTNQNPNAPDFQKPLSYLTAAGQPYHPSRSKVMFNGTPIYLAFQSSAFGYTGRSVFQRALYPMKSFVQSMVTDDMVTFKAGLLIAKQKPATSIVNRMMQAAAGIKRTMLQGGVTGNVLSIDIDEDIESIDLTNTATAMTTGRDNIIANIAVATDVPAIMLKDEAFVGAGFGEGVEDSKAIVQYVDGIRRTILPLIRFFENIVQHRAWNEEFFESVKAAYPEIYGNMTYETAFYQWRKAFKSKWVSMMELSDEDKAKTVDVKLKGITEVLRTILPVVDPTNRATIIQWAADCLNEIEDAFGAILSLDYEAIAEYEPPEPLEQPREPKAKD